MPQNEKNRMPSLGKDAIRNNDQHQKNPATGAGQQNKFNSSNDSNDRGISGMMSDMDDDSISSGTENKKDSLNRDRNNTSR